MDRKDMLSIIEAVLSRVESEPENACLWWDGCDNPVARYAVPACPNDNVVARYAVPACPNDSPIVARYAVVTCTNDAPTVRYAVPAF